MQPQTIRPHHSPKRVHTASSRFWRYAPLVLWAVLIFIGSGDVLSGTHTSILLRAVRWLFPNARSESLALFHLFVRKAGHLTEYAIFATLAARAFRASWHAWLRRHWFWVSLLLAIFYALSDEFHQSFVPSRTASIHDCLIDSVGALIALTIIWLRHRKSAPDRPLTAEATPVS